MSHSDHPAEHNRREWDRRAQQRMAFTRPLNDEELRDPRNAVDGWAWAEGIAGKRVLCLACGGGRQGPAYAKCGGIVTVVDISEEQLAIDRDMTAKHLLDLRTVRTSMDTMPMFDDQYFEMVIHPVSTCYLPNVEQNYREVARVLADGGVYISQHKQPVSLQSDIRRSPRGYEIIVPYDHAEPLPQVTGSPHRETGTQEFLHPWERLVGGMCRAGFVIEDLSEPNHADPTAKPGSFGDRSRFIPPYVRIKARRVVREDGATPTRQLFTP